MPQSPDHSSTEPDPTFTFSQRYGYEPLPEPMRLEHISDDLRIEICNAVRNFLESIFPVPSRGSFPGRGWESEPSRKERKARSFTERVLGRACGVTEYAIKKTLDAAIHDTVSPHSEFFYPEFEDFIKNKAFNKVLDLLEIMIAETQSIYSHTQYENYFTKEIMKLFCKSAYQLDTSQRPYRFFPVVSKEQGEVTQEAIKTLHQRKMNNATDHLRQAAEHMKMNQYGDSVADSIHAVESVAGEVDPKSNKTLGKALNSLEREGLLQNSFLKEALKKLHGYANQPGIRHGQQEGSTVNVGLDEAILMYGACASFAAYLTRKHQPSMPRSSSATSNDEISEQSQVICHEEFPKVSHTYTAITNYCPDTNMYFGCIQGFPGAHTQGKTLKELNDNLKEVISMLNNDSVPVFINNNEHVDAQTFISI